MRIPSIFSRLTPSVAINEIIFINTIVFGFLSIINIFNPELLYGILPWFGFSNKGIFPWTFITAGFTHTEFFHFFMNMLFLYWLGDMLSNVLSYGDTWKIYLFSVLSGTIGMFILSFIGLNSMLIGASGGVYGLFAIANIYFGKNEISIIFLKMEINTLFLVYIGSSILMVLLNSNMGGNLTHLLGALTSYLYYKIKLKN